MTQYSLALLLDLLGDLYEETNDEYLKNDLAGVRAKLWDLIEEEE